MTVSKHILIWIAGIVFFYTCYLLIPVFTPFVVAGILAYLGNPLVAKLEKRRLTRSTAVSIVFFLITLIIAILLLILVPLFIDQLIAFINKIPQQIAWVQTTLLPKVKQILQIEAFDVSPENFTSTLKSSMNIVSNAATNLLSILSSSYSKIITFMINLALIPVLTFYIMRDSNKLTTLIKEILPCSIKDQICTLTIESNQMLGSFLRGQVSVMLALGFIYSIGLSITGLQFGFLIGVIAALVSFVPYLGFITGIVIATIAAWFQFGDIKHLIMVFAVFSVGQVLETFVLTPRFVGGNLGMHPIAVIFALMVGGQLFGFFGLLLALPCCAILMVLLRHSLAWYKKSNLYLKY